MTDETKWITAQEVADHLRISLPLVRRETRYGRLPHRKLGRLVRYRRDEIDAWANAQQRDAVL